MEKTKKVPSLALSLALLALVAVMILTGVVIFETDTHIMLLLSSLIGGAIGVTYLGLTYQELEKGIIEGIMTALQACLILYTVGPLIGTWITSGVVPSMIYYGLSILSPGIFLLATLIICSIVSLATGTSWGTTGTVGIALLGIAIGLGIPGPVAVGAIISGGYAGDKMSPLSDTTNLAPAVSGTDVFQHIRAMCWTTGPTYLIVAVIMIVLGIKYSSGDLDTAKITSMQLMLQKEFWISPVTFLAPLAVITLSVLRKPALPSLWAGVLIAAAFMISQGANYGEILNVMQDGYVPQLSAEIVGASKDPAALAAILAANSITIAPDLAVGAAGDVVSLMERGGLQSMNWTISLILCAFVFGSTMRTCGYIGTILHAITAHVKSVGGLVAAVIFSSFTCNFFFADQYLSIALPGTMFKDAFDEAGLHGRMLSRTLEDGGTLTSVLIPWNTCGAYHTGIYHIPTVEFAPFCFLNYLNPLFAILITYLGIGIFWRGKNGEPVKGGKTRPAELM